MIQIPYYIWKQIINRVIDVIMIILLIITLFPICWMVYCSVKENNDILIGKISLSHAITDVKAIEINDDYYFVCTADGGINKYKRSNNSFEQYVSAGTMTANFAFDEKYIWVSSANRGLIRINKNNLKKQTDFRLPIKKETDITKIASTLMVRKDNYIWYSMRLRGFEGIFEFDTTKNKISRFLDLNCDLSPIQVISMIKIGDVLWIGADMGLLELNIAEGSVKSTYSFELMLPNGIADITPLDSGLLLSGTNGAYIFDLKKRTVVAKYNLSTGLLSDLIQSVFVEGDQIYFGTNAGLSIVNRKTGGIKNFETLFNVLNKEDIAQKGQFTIALVSAIAKDREMLYLGSTMGRLSFFDLNSNSVRPDTLQARRGRLVVAWRNYSDLWRNVPFGSYLKNSIIICGFSMFFSMIIATLAAYAVSRFNFPGSRLFSLGILATQMIPGIMFLIPLFLMFTEFSRMTGIPVKGTYAGLIFIYTAFFTPFSIWILRGFFAAIPIDLEEAARIDGCSPLQVFWHIVLPLALPGIVATGIFIFLTAWDELMFAWVLTSGDTMTIPIGIRNFVGNYQNRFDLIMAATTVATVPVMALFFMLQKHIVKGLTAGAVKG